MVPGIPSTLCSLTYYLLMEYSCDLKSTEFLLKFIIFIHDFISKVMSKENNIFKKS